MSIVIGLKDKNKVWIGADSLITMGSEKFCGVNSNNGKVFKDENDILIGWVGSTKIGNVLRNLRYMVTWHDVEKESLNKYNDGAHILSYLYNKLLPGIKHMLKVEDLIDEKDNTFDGNILIAYKTHLFIILSDFCMLEVDDYIVIGNGSDFAKGALDAYLDTKISPQLKICKAINIAIDNNNTCGGPVVLMNTMDDNPIILD